MTVSELLGRYLLEGLQPRLERNKRSKRVCLLSVLPLLTYGHKGVQLPNSKFW